MTPVAEFAPLEDVERYRDRVRRMDPTARTRLAGLVVAAGIPVTDLQRARPRVAVLDRLRQLADQAQDGPAVTPAEPSHRKEKDPMSTLEDRLDRNSEGWRPKPGDQIVGRIVSLSMYTGGDYGDYPLLEVEADDGRLVAVHAFHTVLRRELGRQKPAVGERIGIRYLGRHDRGYEHYRVVMDRDAPAGETVDWDQVARRADDELDDQADDFDDYVPPDEPDDGESY